jgi:hypothetical protein
MSRMRSSCQIQSFRFIAVDDDEFDTSELLGMFCGVRR